MIPVAAILPLAGSLAKSWWKAGVGALVVAGPVFLMGQCSGADIQKDRAEAARAVATQAAIKTDLGAQAKSADERLADQAEVTNLTEELTDAVAEVPDEKPDAVAVALGCQQLRNAGRDVSGLPACSGPQGRAEARPTP